VHLRVLDVIKRDLNANMADRSAKKNQRRILRFFFERAIFAPDILQLTRAHH
jgi:hypothetical protein